MSRYSLYHYPAGQAKFPTKPLSWKAPKAMLVTPAIPTTPTRSEHPAKAYAGIIRTCAGTVKLPAKVHTTLQKSHEPQPAPVHEEGHAVGSDVP